jgi:hypothetical protein
MESVWGKPFYFVIPNVGWKPLRRWSSGDCSQIRPRPDYGPGFTRFDVCDVYNEFRIAANLYLVKRPVQVGRSGNKVSFFVRGL